MLAACLGEPAPLPSGGAHRGGSVGVPGRFPGSSLAGSGGTGGDPNATLRWRWTDCDHGPTVDPPVQLAFSEDAGTVVLLQSGGVLRSWLNDPLVQTFARSPAAGAAAISADTKYVADRGPSAWRIWDAVVGVVLRELPFPEEPCGLRLAFSADGQHLLALGAPACAIDVHTGAVVARLAAGAASLGWRDGKLVLPFGTQGVTSVDAGGISQDTLFAALNLPRQEPAFVDEPFDVTVISPAGDRAAVHSRGYGFGLYDTQTGALLSSHQQEVPLAFNPVFSPDGAFVLLGERVLKSADGSLALQLSDLPRGFEATALSNDGKRIGFVKPTLDGKEATAIAIEAASGRFLHAVGGHTHPVLSVAVSPDGSHVLTTTGETLLSWKLDSQMDRSRVEWAADAGNEYNARYSPDGKLVAVSSDKPAVLGADGLPVFRPEPLPPARCNSIESLTFSPDGRWVARSAFGTVDIFEQSSWKLVKQLAVKGCIVSASFSPDSRYLMTSVPEMYETESWTQLWTSQLEVDGAPNASSVTFLPSGREAISSACSFGTLNAIPILCIARLFSVGGREVQRLDGLSSWPSIASSDDWIIGGGEAMFRYSVLPRILPSNISASAFAPSGDIIAGTYDGQLLRLCFSR